MNKPSSLTWMIPNDGNGAAADWSRLGTLMPKLPILVSNDGRLLPQTFEGAQITSNDT